MIEPNIRTFYLADSTISSLIGNRFAWGRVPQSAPLPYVRASLISDLTWTPLSSNTCLYSRLIQFSVFAETFEKAATIRDAIIKRTINVTPTSITDVDMIRHEQTRSFTEETNNLATHHIALDLRVICYVT